ncbi:MAG: serine/threonine-protein kinase [Polyangiales bacterium]
MTNLRASWRPSGAGTDGTVMVTHRYDPVAEIGVGGMGAVVLARAFSGPSAGEHVAMKRLLPHLAQEPEVLKAFLDEVYVISALHHPHIVESLDWGEDSNGRFLVMQFVPGDSLRALVHAREAAQSPLPIDFIAEVVACAALGLHAAHTVEVEGRRVGIVHQDVSPANVLVGYDGAVKVIDFGVARILSRDEDSNSQTIRGKFGYMSPEQIRGMPLDHRSDLFSLGVVLWEALTLCRLYQARDEFEVARMVINEEPVSPSELRHDVPAELDRIVLRCLAKNTAERYADGRELARDLEPLRPEFSQRAERIASVTRESMPERFRWIESVTQRPVKIHPRIHSAGEPGRPRRPTGERLPVAPAAAASASAANAVSAASAPAAASASQRAPAQTPATIPIAHAPNAPVAITQQPAPAAPFAQPAPIAQPTAPPQAGPVALRPPSGIAPTNSSGPAKSTANITLRVGALVLVALVALAIGALLGSR